MVEERLKRPLAAEENAAETLLERLGLDSLERMDLALHIEDRFGFRSDRVGETLGELWALAEGQLSAAGDKIEPPPPAWNTPPGDSDEPAVLGETLAEAFVRRMLKNSNDVAAADRMSGVLTYRRLYVAARLMARRFAALVPLSPLPKGEGRLGHEPVGVLLPGSVAANIVFFALHLADRLPVLLNWTTGPANLAHAVKTLGVRHVITSKKLIDRLGIQIEGAEYVYLEDLRGRSASWKRA